MLQTTQTQALIDRRGRCLLCHHIMRCTTSVAQHLGRHFSFPSPYIWLHERIGLIANCYFTFLASQSCTMTFFACVVSPFWIPIITGKTEGPLKKENLVDYTYWLFIGFILTMIFYQIGKYVRWEQERYRELRQATGELEELFFA